jgi:hypothetical protein
VGSMVGVNRALVRRLGRFGADPKADATRILRITGTEHTGVNRMVELLHLDQHEPSGLPATSPRGANEAPASEPWNIWIATAIDPGAACSPARAGSGRS